MKFDKTYEIVVAPGEDGPSQRAAAVLAGDIEAVLGRRPSVRIGHPGSTPALFIASADNPVARPLLRRLRVRTGTIEGQWEAYLFGHRGAVAVICGADAQATVRAVYAFGRDVLGMDPFAHWHGLMPPHRSQIDVARFDRVVGSPAFRFRGWFLNHPQLIGWNLRQRHPYDHDTKYGRIAGQTGLYGAFCPELARLIAETALRADMNLLIPLSYLNIFDDQERAVAEEVAASGLYLSFHHQEPMGANLAYWEDFWRSRGCKAPEMSLHTNPSAFRTWWDAHAVAWARFPRVLWVIGHRGPGDRPFWLGDPHCPTDDASRGRLISKAMSMQVRAIRKACGQRPAHWCATLWQEGSPLHRAGHLRFPKGTIAVMADHGAKQLMREDFFEVKRLPELRYGIYYHVCYGPGGPLAAQGNSPDRMSYALAPVLRKGDTAVALLNVGSIRPYYPGLACWTRLTTSPTGFEPERFLRDWCVERFGKDAAAEIQECYNAYYQNCISPWYKGYDGARGFWDGILTSELINVCQMIEDGDLDQAYPRRVNSTFPDAWNYLSFQRNKTAAVLDAWRSLCRRVTIATRRLPPAPRALLVDNLLVQSELMQALTHGLHDAAAAALALHAGRRTDADRSLTAAAKAIRQGAATVHRLGNAGFYRGWFPRDTLTTIDPRSLEALARRLERQH